VTPVCATCGAWFPDADDPPAACPICEDDREVERIGAALEPWPFERIYGAWWDRVVPAAAKDAVRRSVGRYSAALRGDLPL